MTKSAATLGATCLIALAAAGCASTDPATGTVVRSVAPRNAEAAITNYFDATERSADPDRTLVIGTPVRGACPMDGGAGDYVGWVVPVEHRTRNRDSSIVTITSYFFWFSDGAIRGITRRIDVCP